MNTAWVALSNAPTWVYVLFAYLIWVGFKAFQTRIVSIKKIFIMPSIFTYLSVHTLITAFDIHLFEITTWASAILIGIIIGWLDIYRKSAQIKVDKQKHLIQVPGTWVTLTLILIIFASKYYFGYELATDPELSNQTWFEFSMLAVSGVCTGLFVGRLLAYLNKYFYSSHIALAETD